MEKKKITLDPTKVLQISLGVTLLISVSLLAFVAFSLHDLKEDTDAKLLLLSKDMLSAMSNVRTELNNDLVALQENTTMQADAMRSSLSKMQKSNEIEIKALQNLLDQIETQSSIRFDELREDIATIEVEGADFSGIIDDVIKSVVSVGTNVGQGSGVVVDERGFIVTNYHVVEGASTLRVLSSENKVYDAKLIAFNDGLDLAMLKVNQQFENLEFGDSDDVRIGQKVIAVGNPAGLSFSVSEGIISAVNRKGPNGKSVYIQHDVSINPGNSGGPLIDSSGQIIGINNFKIGGYEGLGFAIESNVVEDFISEVIDAWEEAQAP